MFSGKSGLLSIIRKVKCTKGPQAIGGPPYNIDLCSHSWIQLLPGLCAPPHQSFCLLRLLPTNCTITNLIRWLFLQGFTEASIVSLWLNPSPDRQTSHLHHWAPIQALSHLHVPSLPPSFSLQGHGADFQPQPSHTSWSSTSDPSPQRSLCSASEVPSLSAVGCSLPSAAHFNLVYNGLMRSICWIITPLEYQTSELYF